MKKPADVLEIFLQPGEFYFGGRDVRIRTLLGSCVAITMWHPGRLLGGMCHFMLPERHRPQSGALDGRYADDALQMFLRDIRAAGTTLPEYQVKLFGGGNMFEQHHCANAGKCNNVACRNVAAARHLLHQLKCNVVAEHAGMLGHRNVIFDIWSGDVWVRHIRNAALKEKVIHDEADQGIHSR